MSEPKDTSAEGAADAETRPAKAGETGLTRFGMNESDAEEPPATGGPTRTADSNDNSSNEDQK